jgi:hypothetical protein
MSYIISTFVLLTLIGIMLLAALWTVKLAKTVSCMDEQLGKNNWKFPYLLL